MFCSRRQVGLSIQFYSCLLIFSIQFIVLEIKVNEMTMHLANIEQITLQSEISVLCDSLQTAMVLDVGLERLSVILRIVQRV